MIIQKFFEWCRILERLGDLVVQFPLVMMRTPLLSRVQRLQKEVGKLHPNLLSLLMMLLKLSRLHQEAGEGEEEEAGPLITWNKPPLMQLWGFGSHKGLAFWSHSLQWKPCFYDACEYGDIKNKKYCLFVMTYLTYGNFIICFSFFYTSM